MSTVAFETATIVPAPMPSSTGPLARTTTAPSRARPSSTVDADTGNAAASTMPSAVPNAEIEAVVRKVKARPSDRELGRSHTVR